MRCSASRRHVAATSASRPTTLAIRTPTFVGGAGAGAAVRPRQLVGVVEHEGLELAQLGAGLEADLREPPGERAVGVERLDVTARVVADEHQVPHEVLAQRVVVRELLERGRGLLRAAQVAQGERAQVAQAVADPVQPARLHGRGLVGHRDVGERLAAPQGERLVAGRERLTGSAVRRFVGEPREPVGVDGLGRGGEAVARRLADEDRAGRPGRPAGLEEAAEPGQADVERADDAVRPGRRPRGLDERVGRDGKAGSEARRASSARSLAPGGARPSRRTGPRTESCTLTNVGRSPRADQWG